MYLTNIYYIDEYFIYYLLNKDITVRAPLITRINAVESSILSSFFNKLKKKLFRINLLHFSHNLVTIILINQKYICIYV